MSKIDDLKSELDLAMQDKSVSDWKNGDFFTDIKEQLEMQNNNFEKWVEDNGYSKTKAYDYIKEFNYVIENLNVGGDRLVKYQALPTKARLKLVANSTSDELRESLLTSGITKDSEFNEFMSQQKGVIDVPESKDSEIEKVEQPNTDVTTNDDFDFYSDLEPADRSFYEKADLNLEELRRKATYDLGGLFAKVRDHTANKGNHGGRNVSTFKKWYEAWGFKKTTVFNFINQYELVRQANFMGEEKRVEFLDTFEKLPEKAKAKVSSKNVDPEFRELIMSEKITTNPQYQRLLEEFNQSKKSITEQAEENKRLSADNQKLQRNLLDKTESQSKILQQYNDAARKMHELETEIHEKDNEEPVVVEREPDDYQQLKYERNKMQSKMKQLESELENVSTETVVPEDYEELKARNQEYQETIENMEGQLEEYKQGSSEYEDLKRKIKDMTDQRDEVGRNVSAFEKVIDLAHGLEGNLNQVSVLALSAYVRDLSHEDLMGTSLPGIRDQVERLLNELNTVLKNDKGVIEGEFEDIKGGVTNG